MSIAITGATGQLGQLVVESLLKKVSPEKIVALVRNVDKAQHFKDQKVDVRLFDYDKPETLVPALRNVERLLLISSSAVGARVSQHKNVVEAAKEAGVSFIAYTSFLNAPEAKLPLAEEHRQTEAIIKESGIKYAFLRNGWYTENYVAGLRSALIHNAVFAAAKDAKIASATRLEYAQAAAEVLTTDGIDKKIYELAGSDSYTLTDFAKVISEVSGKDIKYTDLPPKEYLDLLLGVGLPEPLAELLVDADVQAIDGALYSDSKDLENLLGHPTAPLSEAVKDALATLKA